METETIGNMKIFFSVSISGNHEHKKYYPEIISELKKHGEVLTEFRDLKSENYTDAELSTVNIYKRDTELIKASDAVVAEVSVPSLGVGYEVAYAEALGKLIIGLHIPVDDIKLSAMIKGCPNVKLYEYNSIEDIGEVIKKAFDEK